VSRAQRRATRTPVRSRRTPVKPQGRSAGFQVPWVPLAVLLGIVVVVGIVGYLVIQAGKSSNNFSAQQAYEQDQQLNAPGEWVDLPTAWGDGTNLAHYGQSSSAGPNTNAHVTHSVDYSKETSASSSTGLPPAGGPHWGSSACGQDPATAPSYCGPAPWGLYVSSGWPAATMVHNMEHGGVIVWYNTTNQDVLNQLEALVTQRLKDGYYIVATPYSDVPADTIWLTAWSRRELIPVSEYSNDKVDTFIKYFNCRFNPENFGKCK
jgi:hypothetical protein